MRNATIEGRLDMIRDALAIIAESMQLIRRSVAAIQAELDADEAELHAESAAAMGGDNMHDELVAALTHCHDWILAQQSPPDFAGEPIRLEAAMALAKAKGTHEP